MLFQITSFTILFVIKKTLGLRVLKGLDLSEHDMDSYADFRLNILNNLKNNNLPHFYLKLSCVQYS